MLEVTYLGMVLNQSIRCLYGLFHPWMLWQWLQLLWQRLLRVRLLWVAGAGAVVVLLWQRLLWLLWRWLL